MRPHGVDVGDTRITPGRFAGLVALALILAVLPYAVQGDVGLNLTDEGLFWYVTTRTAAGDVPLRDVRSFEPGRYYWSAVWLRVLGPGVKALRISLAVLQGVGLVLAFLLLRRVVPAVAGLAVLGLVVVVWMWPMYRSFENVAVLALLLAAARLVERPLASRWRAAGVVVGLAAFVRIDHGVYGALAFLLLLVFTTTRLDGIPLGVAVVNWTLGAIVGYSPMFLLALLAPGFVRGFTANLAYMARTTLWAGTFSLPLPVPWLWAVPPSLAGRSFADAAALVALSTLFTLMPAVLVLAGYLAFRARGAATPQQAQLAAAAAVGVPYLSHTFSRADLQHLTATAMTLVVAITALVTSLPAAARRIACLAAVPLALVATYLVVVTETPYGIRMRRPQLYVRSDVAGDVLWLNRSTVEIIDSVKRATAAHVGARPLLVIPLWPGSYPVLGRRRSGRSTRCSRSPNHGSARRSRDSGVRASTGCSWPTSCPSPERTCVSAALIDSCGSTSGRISTGSPLTLVTHGSTCCDAGFPRSHEGRHRGTLRAIFKSRPARWPKPQGRQQNHEPEHDRVHSENQGDTIRARVRQA